MKYLATVNNLPICKKECEFYLGLVCFEDELVRFNSRIEADDAATRFALHRNNNGDGKRKYLPTQSIAILI